MNLFKLFSHPEALVDLSPSQLEQHLSDRVILVDVRTRHEYRAGHISGAVSIPLGHEASLADRYSLDLDVVLICKTGHRSQAAAATLISLGFSKVFHLRGGMDGWRHAGKPLETGEPAP